MRTPTRTDALIACAAMALESQRAFIDSTASIKSITISLKIDAEGRVHDAMVQPTLEATVSMAAQNAKRLGNYTF